MLEEAMVMSMVLISKCIRLHKAEDKLLNEIKKQRFKLFCFSYDSQGLKRDNRGF